jgi:hypothetical protein
MRPFYDPRMPAPIYAASHSSRDPTGSQRSQALSDTGRRPATVSAPNWLFRRHQATPRDGTASTYKRGVTGSKPVCGRQLRSSTLSGAWRGVVRVRTFCTVSRRPAGRLARKAYGPWAAMNVKCHSAGGFAPAPSLSGSAGTRQGRLQLQGNRIGKSAW